MSRYIEAVSSYAGQIDGLVWFVFWLVGFWTVLCYVVFFGFLFRFRRGAAPRGDYVTGEEKHLKRWVTIPHLLVLVCDIFIIYGAVRVWYHIKQELPPAQQTVRVISQQWAWTFVHPGPDGALDTADDISTINELHVQANTMYHYLLESKDVLHNFSVPVFRLKQDAVPGRVITGWFEAQKTGQWDVQCAEICGIGHGLMGARVFVESPAEHAAWISQHAQPTSLASAAGR
jgi:cytochrome c oxidase subunit 2